MITPRHLAGTALVLCWAILLSARSIAAAIYATRASGNYEAGLRNIGWLLPFAAWAALIGGLFLLLDARRSIATARVESGDHPPVPQRDPVAH